MEFFSVTNWWNSLFCPPLLRLIGEIRDFINNWETSRYFSAHDSHIFNFSNDQLRKVANFFLIYIEEIRDFLPAKNWWYICHFSRLVNEILYFFSGTDRWNSRFPSTSDFTKFAIFFLEPFTKYENFFRNRLVEIVNFSWSRL